MLNKKFGPVIEIKFLEEIISVNLQIEILKFPDILRITEILKKYKSLNIGFVDGSIVAISLPSVNNAPIAIFIFCLSSVNFATSSFPLSRDTPVEMLGTQNGKYLGQDAQEDSYPYH